MLKKMSTVFLCLTALACSWQINSQPIFKDFASSYEISELYSSSSARLKFAEKKEYVLSFLRTGESVTIYEKFSVEELLKILGAKKIFTEQTEFGLSVYAYSKQLPYRKIINGEIVNVQIFIGDSKVVVGSPIIFGSF